jgi:hypothetical protein
LSRAPIAAAIVAAAELLVPSAARAQATAQEVAASCRELLKPNPPKSFEVGLCVGSFTTLHALSGLVDQNRAPILGFCRPPDADYRELARVFVRHVEAHPQSAQVYYVIEAVNALADAYPCKAKK